MIYQATITNDGPAIATNVQFQTTLTDPTLAKYDKADSEQGTLASQVLDPDTGQPTGAVLLTFYAPNDLAPGETATWTFAVTPLVSTNLSTTVSATSSTADQDPSASSFTLVTPISPADLGVTMSVPAGTFTVGDPVTYTVNLTNNGPATATHVTATVPLPLNTAMVSSASGTTGLNVSFVNGAFTATMGSLASGKSGTFTITVRPSSAVVDPTTHKGTLTAAATVTADQVDPVQTNNTASAMANVQNLAGQVQFSQANYQVSEKGGFATITVNRSGGTLGQLKVNYAATAGANAVANVDFTPTSGTLIFNDGDTTQTFTVPVIDNGVLKGDVTVNLALTPISPSNAVGTQSKATLTVKEADYSINGPQVSTAATQLLGTTTITGVTLTFTEPMDPTRAGNRANYLITLPGRAATPVSSASYNPTARTVTLGFGTVPAGTFVQLTLVSASATNPTNPAGLEGISGVPLDGSGTGTPGTNYVVSFGRGPTLAYRDQFNNLVTLKLTGPGVLDIQRDANGNSTRVRVTGGTYQSILTGTVQKATGFNGLVNLGVLQGTGSGGAVSRLSPTVFTWTTAPLTLTAVTRVATTATVVKVVPRPSVLIRRF